MDFTNTLSMDLISRIISYTNPRDACRLAATCRVFKLAADSDYLWERFLPSDYKDIISSSVSSSSLITSMSKRVLYFHLCYDPILINNGTMSFGLDQESGKKCLMVGARELNIMWGNSPQYWKWPSLPESRFPEVAELELVWWFDIKGRIETKNLSSKTNYAAYLVFKLADFSYGFETRPINLDVYFEGSERRTRSVLLGPPENMPQLSQGRTDGWMEIEMGEFFNENGEEGMLFCSLFDFDASSPKRGIIIQGIELRPKNADS